MQGTKLAIFFSSNCLLLLLACATAFAQAPQPLVIAPGDSDVPLSPHIRYHHDSESTLRPEDAWQHAQTRDFAPLPDGRDAFGFQRGAFWFHLPVVNQNPEEPRWLLVQSYPLSDRIDVYARYPDGRVVHHAGGDSLPFEARSVRYRHPNFQFELPLDTPVEFLVRVESQSSMQVPLRLYTPKAFTELSRDAQFIIGIYYGILLALFFYNLVLWISLRDASYFWYLMHISAFGLVLFTLNGFGFEYLWPNSPWLADRAVPLSICLALIGMQQFARTFLDLPKRWPKGNLVSLALIAFFIVWGIASVWLPYRISTPVASRAVLLGVLWIAIASVVVLRQGYKPAQLFLLAWGMFLLGTTLFTLVAFGIVPKTLVTEYGVQIGSALEMLLLSIALGHRYGVLRNENERITAEANQQLERKVAQRTQEVRHALVQLEEAHERLRDSSRRDGLTGLYNRTYFHERFETMLDECRDARRPLSLLMIDLDHFKSINDQHGHLVGDDCLRWAAQRIGKTLRPHDALLARFGGEEFVVALPATDLRTAVAVAESVRQALVADACTSQELRVSISASIGVHTVAADAMDDIDDAFETADRALYAAKANGRDCVRTSITAA
ncbi:diguanylate cyclase [Luteimonas aestuarii]|uniref:diguanylate cyclase n=1 Tax=Luteimonas aestuarii TaxID=453837 RepID=A0A4R5TS17_9GAMM|nr:diguanylate cyclase [Luteimonas aestuarii]TDK22299.1 diguanylate cyclase [Luteimonas aestuarii]